MHIVGTRLHVFICFVITERSEMGRYEASLLDVGMMFANVYVCGMMLLFSAMVYMLVRYASPSSPMWFRCMILY